MIPNGKDLLTKNAEVVWDDQLIPFALSRLSCDGQVCDLQLNQKASGHRYLPGIIGMSRIGVWVPWGLDDTFPPLNNYRIITSCGENSTWSNTVLYYANCCFCLRWKLKINLKLLFFLNLICQDECLCYFAADGEQHALIQNCSTDRSIIKHLNWPQEKMALLANS